MKTKEKLFIESYNPEVRPHAQDWDMSVNPFQESSIYHDWYEDKKDCTECQSKLVYGGGGPTHRGSSLCRMGTSIAAGGYRSHCTCAACF